MSQVKIQGNASGTGIFTVAAPNSNTDRTLTLPDTTGTVLNDQSDITAQVKTATNASGSAPIYSCRAWVNFNASSGSPVIRGSGNISSITDNALGDFTLNFSTSMPDANYAHIATARGGNSSYQREAQPYSEASVLSGSLRILSKYWDGVTSAPADDSSFIQVIIFR